MKKSCLLFALLMATIFCQAQQGVALYLSFQGNKTVTDRTLSNNSGGVGLGIQALLNTKTAFKPMLEINGDYFGGTKELYMTTDGKIIKSKNEVVGIYAGPSFQPAGRLFFATTAGASFYNNKTHFGVRPSAGLFLSKNKKWLAKASYNLVFQRDDMGNEKFGYAGFGLAGNLF